MKKLIALLTAAVMLCSFTACAGKTEKPAGADAEYAGSHMVMLSDSGVTVDGTAVREYDYIWHSNPSAESEWYEGEEPDRSGAYIAHDIWYYPELDKTGFTAELYDGETEWVYHYTAEGLTDYIYATLPYFMGDSTLPAEMMHSAEEAYRNRVLHITEPGTYVLTGTWHGQIFVDLGDRDETFTDKNAKVTFILSGADVTCDCAPAIIFYSAYECDNAWEEREERTNLIDTADAGVNIVIADGTENSFTGANVYRMLKPKYKKEGSTLQKKAHKTDGAFYSFVSMNIGGGEKGTGILNITSTSFEGLDTELHLTVNGGYINIYSQDDGINVNEDNVSVFTMNGGTLHIFAGLGAEGDCVDSNGYIVVNGGLIAGGTPSSSDEILDSDCGNTINGGKVIAIGSGGMDPFGPDGGMPGMFGPDAPPPDMDGSWPEFPGMNGNMPPDMNSGRPPEPGNGMQEPPDMN